MTHTPRSCTGFIKTDEDKVRMREDCISYVIFSCKTNAECVPKVKSMSTHKHYNYAGSIKTKRTRSGRESIHTALTRSTDQA